MFKSLQWKLVTVSVLLVLAISIVAGTFLVLRVSDYYQNMFADEMASTFTPEFVRYMEKSSEDDDFFIQNTMPMYASQLGIDFYRNYYIVNADNHIVLSGTAEATSDVFVDSENFITALTGQVGNKTDLRQPFMDYAHPIRTVSGMQIIYIKDTKDELKQVIYYILEITIQAMILGVIISVLMGYFFREQLQHRFPT